MPSCFLRILVLTMSLPLALPAGWCCMVRPATARTTAGSVCPTPTKPCGCGCGQSEADPSPSEDGSSRPRPLDPGKCCCSDRNTLLSKSTDISPADLFVTALLPPLMEGVAAPGLAGSARRSAFVHSPPTHVLLCVWLC